MKNITRLKNKSGSTMIIFACSLGVIFILSALVTDLGYIAVEKTKLVNTSDAAALAGAQDLIVDKSEAIQAAKSFIEKNQKHLDSVQVAVSHDRSAITVKIKKTVDYFFMRFLGYTTRQLSAESTVVVSTISSYKGVRPFAVERQQFVFGREYILKEGAGSGMQGNYGALALLGTGANNFRDNVINGVQHKLKVGDWVYTETGNMKNPTKQGIQHLISRCNHVPICQYNSYVKDCPRLIVIPVIDSLDVDGRKAVQVVGFASFFIKDYTDEGGHSQIIGHFIENVVVGDMSDGVHDFGTVGIRLVK